MRSSEAQTRCKGPPRHGLCVKHIMLPSTVMFGIPYLAKQMQRYPDLQQQVRLHRQEEDLPRLTSPYLHHVVFGTIHSHQARYNQNKHIQDEHITFGFRLTTNHIEMSSRVFLHWRRERLGRIVHIKPDHGEVKRKKYKTQSNIHGRCKASQFVLHDGKTTISMRNGENPQSKCFELAILSLDEFRDEKEGKTQRGCVCYAWKI